MVGGKNTTGHLIFQKFLALGDLESTHLFSRNTPAMHLCYHMEYC